MPPDLALSSTLIGSNYPCLEIIFMVPMVFEPLKFDCMYDNWRYPHSALSAISLDSAPYYMKYIFQT